MIAGVQIRRSFRPALAAILILGAAGACPAAPPLRLAESFAALGDDLAGVPPDPQGAAGPAHLMTALNTRWAVQSKEGALLREWTPEQFWSGVSEGDFLFDPRLLYDSFWGRWIAVMATAGVTAEPAILLAVSDGPDPTQGWSFQRLPADPSEESYAEFPLLGANSRWICLTSNLVSRSTGTLSGSAIWIIEKTGPGAAAPLPYSRIVLSDPGSPLAPAVTFDPDEPDEFLLQQWSRNDGGVGKLRILRVTEKDGVPALATSHFVAAPVAWSDHPVPFDALPQADTSRRITSDQDEIASVCLRGGILWAVQTATLPSGPAAGHTVVQWWKIAPDARLLGFGRIADPAGSAWLGYPSLAVNTRGQVVVGYSIFSPDAYASAGYSVDSGDGCGPGLAEIHMLRAGQSPYIRPDEAGHNRWGDLSETVVDPQDGLRIWTIQEYAAQAPPDSGRWATWWGAFSPAAGRASGCLAPRPLAEIPSVSGRSRR